MSVTGPYAVRYDPKALRELTLRVGDYRVIYTVKDAELVVLVLRVAHRSNVYRDL